MFAAGKQGNTSKDIMTSFSFLTGFAINRHRSPPCFPQGLRCHFFKRFHQCPTAGV